MSRILENGAHAGAKGRVPYALKYGSARTLGRIRRIGRLIQAANGLILIELEGWFAFGHEQRFSYSAGINGSGERAQRIQARAAMARARRVRPIPP